MKTLTFTGLLVLTFCWTLATSSLVAQQAPTAELQFRTAPVQTFARRLVQEGLPEAVDEQLLFKDWQPSEVLWKGHLQYGSANSKSVSVVLTSDFQLAVDVDRDFRIQRDEVFSSLPGEPPSFLIRLPARYRDGNQVVSQPQQVQFTWDASIRSMWVASAGVMTGLAKIDSETVIAEIQDRNVNGCWFDPEDRLFLDMNGDGKLDRIRERFSGSATRRIKGRPFALQSEISGRRVSLKEVTAVGNIDVQLDLDFEDISLEHMTVRLESESGVQLLVRSLESIAVPVGRYRVEEVQLEIRDPQGRQHLQFACFDRKRHPIVVSENATAKCPLLGEWRWEASHVITGVKEQRDLILTPMVLTESGLFLRNYKREEPDSGSFDNRMQAVFETSTGVFATGSSGYT